VGFQNKNGRQTQADLIVLTRLDGIEIIVRRIRTKPGGVGTRRIDELVETLKRNKFRQVSADNINFDKSDRSKRGKIKYLLHVWLMKLTLPKAPHDEACNLVI
jgi:hypothetical protein